MSTDRMETAAARTERPLLSIIVPSFNQAAFLDATLTSILGQNFPDGVEVIVMDGGSTDGSVDILRKYDGRIAWLSEKDRGQSHAFNKGLARARGEIIGWLNSDDLYLNQCLSDAAAFFRAHPEVDIVFADYIFIDEHGALLKKRREPPFDHATYVWTGDCYHANCAGFFRKRVFDRVGGLSEEFHYGMDYEFYLRAHQAGFRFAHVRAFWGAYRLHQGSKSITAYDRQKQDGRAIAAKYRPADAGAFQQKILNVFYSARRLAQKTWLLVDRRRAP